MCLLLYASTSSLVKEMWTEPFSLKMKLEVKLLLVLLSSTGWHAADTFRYTNDFSALSALKSGPALSPNANSLFGNGRAVWSIYIYYIQYTPKTIQCLVTRAQRSVNNYTDNLYSCMAPRTTQINSRFGCACNWNCSFGAMLMIFHFNSRPLLRWLFDIISIMSSR